MRLRPKLAAAVIVLSLAPLAGPRAPGDDKPAGASRAALSRSDLEKEFAARLSGAAMVGRYAIDGKDEGAAPKSDRYEIAKAEKLDGDRWMITARMTYGKNDLKLPVPIDVYWAGDTPVITLTKATIPGLGTFTARVMVYGERYVGTWQHDAVGGHMWGRIEKSKPASPPKSTAPSKSS